MKTNKDLFDMKVSYTGRYIMGNNMIYDVLRDNSIKVESTSEIFWLKFLKENSEISYKTNRYNEHTLQTLLRQTVYYISETFETNQKINTLMEYERKYGSTLILESNNRYSFEKTLSEGWIFLINSVGKNIYGVLEENWFTDKVSGAVDWVSDKASAVGDWVSDKAKKVAKAYQEGGITNVISKTYDYAANKLAQAWNWVKNKGISFFMEGLREAVYSPVGMAVEIFLTATGIGAPVVMVVYAVLLIYDVYLLFSGSEDFHWLNLIFDILGVATSGVAAPPARLAAKEAGMLAKGGGKSLEAVVETGIKKGGKIGGFIRQVGSLIVKGIGAILKFLQQGAAWVSKNFGITFLEKWIGKAVQTCEKIGTTIAKGGGKEVVKTAGKDVATTTSKEVVTTAGKEAVKKPGLITRGLKKIDAATNVLTKPIEKIAPITQKRFKKDIFGRTIVGGEKISQGLSKAAVLGTTGYGLHKYGIHKGEVRKKEEEKQTIETLKQGKNIMKGAKVSDDVA